MSIGSTHRTAKFAKKTLPGLNPGQPKIAGLEVLSGRHLPEAYRGNLIGHDFRGHRTARFILSEDGSGYASRRSNDLVSTSHAAFRPIDVKMGPDGAIYIADWYNPIIQHGEVDFRDKRRDHTHGRIWRVTAQGRSLVEKPKLAGAPIEQLLEQLKAPEQWTREQAKRVLAEKPSKEVLPAVVAWAQKLGSKDPQHPHHLLEAAWVLLSHDRIRPDWLDRLARGPEPRAHAAAVRIATTWVLENPQAYRKLQDRIDPIIDLAVRSAHPRTRLEAVHFLRQRGSLPALRRAMRVVDQPTDRNLDFALWQMLSDHESVWSEPLQAGRQPFEKVSHLLFAMKAAGSASVRGALVSLLDSADLPAADRPEVLALMAEAGTPKDLTRVLGEALKAEPDLKLRLLEALGRSRYRPTQGADKLAGLLKSSSAPIRRAAMRLMGRWKAPGALAALSGLMEEAATAADRRVAIEALGLLGTKPAREKLKGLVEDAKAPVDLRMEALTALARVDPNGTTKLVQKQLPTMGGADPAALIQTYLSAKKGANWLKSAVSGTKLPADLAAAAVRVIGSSGRRMDSLVNVFIKAGGLQPLPAKLSDEQVARLAEEVEKSGDAARGERVYRMNQIACMTCHAIGGAGGVVGPDLVSIGASAPVDYLIESLFEPNKKIKEGYHLTTVQTKDGKVYTGMVVRKTSKETVLRDATGKETVIDAANIQKQTITPTSLMPPGLTASLRRDQVVDLLRFLSELGKEGPFKVGPERQVRRFRVNANSHEPNHARNRRGNAVFAQDPDRIGWAPAYARVDGRLYPGEFPKFRGYVKNYSVFRFEIEVTTPGNVGLKFSRTEGIDLWVDGVAAGLEKLTTLKLTRGRHAMTMVVQRLPKEVPFSIEVVDLLGSPAKAQPVGGP